MEIKVLKTFLDGRNPFEVGEVRKVDDVDGEYFCSCGWAEDVAGTVPTGEIKPGTTRLDIRGIKREHKTEAVG